MGILTALLKLAGMVGPGIHRPEGGVCNREAGLKIYYCGVKILKDEKRNNTAIHASNAFWDIPGYLGHLL